MIGLSDIRNHLNDIVGHVTFDYNGQSCGIDPISIDKFEMWYGDTSVTANSIDEVFDKLLFDGKNLNDIWNDVTDVDM